jgi:hypothetical protein
LMLFCAAMSLTGKTAAAHGRKGEGERERKRISMVGSGRA